MDQRVYSLPGPFQVQRIVEFEGPALDPEALFPDSTREQIRQAKAGQDPRLFDGSANLLIMSFHSVLVRTSHLTILVDTCIGNDKERPRNPHWHQRRGSFLQDLVQAGVRPEEVDIVMCTHLHADHVGWNTRLENGRWVPTFPNARYLFAQREVDHWQQVLKESPPSEVNHGSWADSVAPVIEAGQAVLLPEEHSVADGVDLLPAPGHTPGTVIVRLEDQGELAYLTGDVIHHPLQLEYPEWSTCFCWDPAQSATSRRQTLDAVANEEAWLLPAHFPTPTATKIRHVADQFEMA